jgi:5S rRNA maturation endonuclease (ribonuclease M5)
VIYSIGDKRYFSIGFKNDKNGYELRNKFFKNCTSPKWYTYLNNGNDKLIIFEGFFDFLSLLQANQKSRNGYDYLVLNSVTLRKKIPLELLENYAQIFLFLDNDDAGRDASQFFISSLPNVTDCSSLYGTYKDVNEWLVKRKKRE